VISPRKPTAGFWITVALVAVLVGYPLSIGPACWRLATTDDLSVPMFADSSSPVPTSYEHPCVAPILYWPLGWAADKGPQPLRDAARSYVTLRNDCIAVPCRHDGGEHLIFRAR
jgi:hypothetical protein